MKTITQGIVCKTLLVSLPLLTACGETVNYETQEEARAMLDSPSSATQAGTGDLESDGVDPNRDVSQSTSSTTKRTLPENLSPEEALALCSNTEQQTLKEKIVFPELAAGRTCAFGSGDNLTRKDLFFRAQLRQEHSVQLPEGAVFCGFTLSHQAAAMRYDDEMFFLLNDRILLSTKNYSDYFPATGMFSSYAWPSLRDKPYNPSDTSRGLYCMGGAEGLSQCQLPPTETSGQIQLKFSPEMTLALASRLASEKTLSFSWITTGDNDDSDCRHSEISFNMDVHYILP